MVLIFHAFGREVAALKKRLAGRARLPKPLNGFEARLGDQRILMVATAMGTKRARDAVREALKILPVPRLVITCGVAGALSPQLRTGEVLLPDRILLSEGGRCDEPRAVAIAPQTLEMAERAMSGAGLAWHTGTLLTAGSVVATANDKRATYEATAALAVDMESGAIAEEIGAQGLPPLCLRTIMDEAHEEIPGAAAVGTDGRLSPLRAAGVFLKNPAIAARLPSLMRKLDRAGTSLARALEVICAASQEMARDAGRMPPFANDRH